MITPEQERIFKLRRIWEDSQIVTREVERTMKHAQSDYQEALLTEKHHLNNYMGALEMKASEVQSGSTKS